MPAYRYTFERFCIDMALLGLKPDETIKADAVKRRHRTRIQTAHPDKPGGSTRKTQDLNAARDNLLEWLKRGAPAWPDQAMAGVREQEAAQRAERESATRRRKDAEDAKAREEQARAAAAKAAAEAGQAQARARADAARREAEAAAAMAAGQARRDRAAAAEAARRHQEAEDAKARDEAARRKDEEARRAQDTADLAEQRDRRLADEQKTKRRWSRLARLAGRSLHVLLHLIGYPLFGVGWLLSVSPPLVGALLLGVGWVVKILLTRFIPGFATVVTGVAVYAWVHGGMTMPHLTMPTASILPVNLIPGWMSGGAPSDRDRDQNAPAGYVWNTHTKSYLPANFPQPYFAEGEGLDEAARRNARPGYAWDAWKHQYIPLHH